MEQYLKSYHVIMQTVGPVFVGSGKEIMKKEYIFMDDRKTVGIPDVQRLYAVLMKNKKEKAFEEYLLGKGSMNLTEWLDRQRIKERDLKPLLKYVLDCGDAVIDRGGNKLQIMECVKDAYGNPYIPGSSLKGMFRTILLGADIINAPEKYQREKENIRREAVQKAGRNYYLKKDMDKIEYKMYRTLDRPKYKPEDAVNDLMQGFIVSDSEPLATSDLVLCQKIDRHVDGTERKLPLLRECIKPDTEIRFTITIDTNLCKLTGKLLMEAVKAFISNYYSNFSKSFSGMDVPKANYVLCGGGCGFVSKTIVYPMFEKTEGIEIAQRVFEHTIPEQINRQHKHHKDKQYGVSPHTMKCTRYQGKLMQMGVCKILKIKLR